MHSLDQVHTMLLACLPKGRAWQSRDAAIPWEISVLKRVMRAIAVVWLDLETRADNFIAEMAAGTADQMRQEWLTEYGLPDFSDPQGRSLVMRAMAEGDWSAQYYANYAMAFGWSVAARWLNGDDPEFPGVRATLHLVINAAASPATRPRISVSTWTLGSNSLLGVVNVTRLIAAFDRIVPADAAITYNVE